jgi:hypothetical protein
MNKIKQIAAIFRHAAYQAGARGCSLDDSGARPAQISNLIKLWCSEIGQIG